LRERIETNRYSFSGSTIAVTISAGVAVYRANESRESFIARADTLLYQAKNEGRNRVCAEHVEKDLVDI
jgi:diguanylate cyclase (GGDEF)-like protein